MGGLGGSVGEWHRVATPMICQCKRWLMPPPECSKLGTAHVFVSLRIDVRGYMATQQVPL